jgi:hypothetical protein
MNPVLATTTEFNQYIQDKLHPRTSTDKRRPITAAAQENHSRRSDYSRIIQANTIQKEIHLKGNSRPQSAPKHRSGDSTTTSSVRSSKQEEKPAYEFVHSWSRHLNRSPSPSLHPEVKVPTALGSRRTYDEAKMSAGFNRMKLDDDDGEEIEPRSLRIIPQTEIVSTYNDDLPVSSSSSSSLSSIEFKLRIKKLQRLFAAWRKQTQESNHWYSLLLFKMNQLRRRFTLTFFFQEWYNISLADSFIHERLYLKRKNYLSLWLKVCCCCFCISLLFLIPCIFFLYY